jgi:hypothetical protein
MGMEGRHGEETKGKVVTISRSKVEDLEKSSTLNIILK